MKPEAWTEALEQRFAKEKWRYAVLPPGEILNFETLGSSPGDTYYDGEKFIFEFACPLWWIYHEAAHWYDVKSRGYASRLKLKNYGFEATDGFDVESTALLNPRQQQRQRLARRMEERASLWTIGLMLIDGVDADLCELASEQLSLTADLPTCRRKTRRVFSQKGWL